MFNGYCTLLLCELHCTYVHVCLFCQQTIIETKALWATAFKLCVPNVYHSHSCMMELTCNISWTLCTFCISFETFRINLFAFTCYVKMRDAAISFHFVLYAMRPHQSGFFLWENKHICSFDLAIDIDLHIRIPIRNFFFNLFVREEKENPKNISKSPIMGNSNETQKRKVTHWRRLNLNNYSLQKVLFI